MKKILQLIVLNSLYVTSNNNENEFINYNYASANNYNQNEAINDEMKLINKKEQKIKEILAIIPYQIKPELVYGAKNLIISAINNENHKINYIIYKKLTKKNGALPVSEWNL